MGYAKAELGDFQGSLEAAAPSQFALFWLKKTWAQEGTGVRTNHPKSFDLVYEHPNKRLFIFFNWHVSQGYRVPIWFLHTGFLGQAFHEVLALLTVGSVTQQHIYAHIH